MEGQATLEQRRAGFVRSLRSQQTEGAARDIKYVLRLAIVRHRKKLACGMDTFVGAASVRARDTAAAAASTAAAAEAPPVTGRALPTAAAAEAPPCTCRALPTDDETAAAETEEGEDSLRQWIEPSMERNPFLTYDDARARAVRNVQQRETRAQRRAAGLEECAAPALPHATPVLDAATAPMVSVIVPTSFTRHWAHETLYKCFDAQTWPGALELLILDTGGPKSPFFTGECRDRRVRYFHAALPPAPARTVGGKRNWLGTRAKGSLIAAFDDDDIYMPDYLTRMVSALIADKADMVKLSSWLSFETDTDALCRFDAEKDAAWGHHSRRWGYGFSYVYTAELANKGFPPIDHGED